VGSLKTRSGAFFFADPPDCAWVVASGLRPTPLGAPLRWSVARLILRVRHASQRRRRRDTESENNDMFKWAVIFAVIAVIAGLFGFTGIAAGAAGIAKILFIVFLVLFVAVVLFALLGIGAATKK
jgi:uncharacterized membrane protein YtjA (UPF0391 family)